MKKAVSFLLVLLLSVTACGNSGTGAKGGNPQTEGADDRTQGAVSSADTAVSGEEDHQMEEKSLRMTIGGAAVAVDWEDNASVDALRELAKDGPLAVDMSMYGGFEQVGSLGGSLPRDDEQTTTQAGDIVLYSGNQIVVFYGSNSWAYTRLGHISDRTASDMAKLLGNGDVTITLSME